MFFIFKYSVSHYITFKFNAVIFMLIMNVQYYLLFDSSGLEKYMVKYFYRALDFASCK